MKMLLDKFGYFSLIALYGYYIYLGLFYFKKDQIEDKMHFNLTKYIGLILIILLLYLGYYSTITVEQSMIIALLNSASFYLLVSATRIHSNSPLNFAFSKTAPERITTYGVYKYIRHPIYTSYIIGWISGIILTSSLVPVPLVIIMTISYLAAIKKEEREYLDSSLASEYLAYVNKTQRIIPFIY